MGWYDTLKKLVGTAAGTAPAAVSPVGAIAGAVGSVAGAVKSVEDLQDHKQILVAGATEGIAQDAAKTEARVDAAAAARSDDKLRSSVEAARFRD